MKLTINEIKRLFKTIPSMKDTKVSQITADSRNIKKNGVFFALKAENDGHKYAAKAVENGASLVVVEKKIKGLPDEKQAVVGDTKEALLKLAGYYFKKFPRVKAIGITGSNGKTTTKELLGALLKSKYAVNMNEKSFNNYLGLPLTIFNLNDSHEILIVEIGMNHKGEIKKLVSVLKLDAAIITNVGRAHIGFFKDGKKGIADAKAEIFEGVKAGGTAIINADDDFAGYLTKKAKSKKLKVITFGLKNMADTTVTQYKAAQDTVEFKVNVLKEELSMRLKGIHNLYNISAAIGAARLFKVSGKQIKKALLKFKMEGFMRFEEIKFKNGITLINDCYNANPDSFIASIETLKKAGHKYLLVLMGDMMELGSNSAAFHREIGKKFKEIEIEKFFIYGKQALKVKKGYGGEATIYTDRRKLAVDLGNAVKPGCVVFVKGSRGNKLEEITAEAFKRFE
jgi:UDP-N-acetylmuramoyl-tripeptide--D-alanyl-D-alanine ligase